MNTIMNKNTFVSCHPGFVLYPSNRAKQMQESHRPIVDDLFNLQRFNSYTYANNSPMRFTDPTGYDGFDDVYLGPGTRTWNGINPEQDGNSGLFGSGGGGGNSSYTLPEVTITAYSPVWDNWKNWYRQNNDPYLIWGNNAGANAGGMFGSMSVSDTRRYWQNMSMRGGGSAGGGIDRRNVANASLGLVDGIAEVVLAGGADVLSDFSATSSIEPIVVDGLVRITSNGARLISYISGNNKLGNAIPGNTGAWVGKGIDMVSGKTFYDYGFGQAFGGATNDVISFIVTGGTAKSMSGLIDSPSLVNGELYFLSTGGYTQSLFFDFYPLKKDTIP
jgi:hypothetical protein